MADITYIPIRQLYPHPDNPRKELGDLSELAASIKENGVYQNLTVIPGHYLNSREYIAKCVDEGGDAAAAAAAWTPKAVWSSEDYTIIIGHRRAAAAQQAGVYELPCAIVEMDEREQMQTMMIENMQRSDLTVYEQAQGFQMMMDFGQTVEQISDKSGFSQSTVRRRIKLLELNHDSFKKAEKRGATLSDFAQLDKIEDLEARNRVLETLGTQNFNRAMQVVYNTRLGLLWEDRGDVQDEDTMLGRREEYPAELPDGVLVLTAGVDTQDDRMEYEIVGFGHFGETWGIEKGIISGRPDSDEVWQQLDELVFDRKLKFVDGLELPVSIKFVDEGGHFTQEVRQRCHDRIGKKVFCIKGFPGSDRPFTGPPKQVKITVQNRYIGMCWQYQLGVDAGKQIIIPYESPSNKTVHIDGLCDDDGAAINLTYNQANVVDAAGICTFLNFMGGWTAWGNHTACYPKSTDVKDYFIPLSRMFDYVSNTLIKTFWSKLDKPMNRRLIDTILDSANVWLNGLVGAGYLLGARVEMLESENPLTSLMAGKIKLHVYMTPPSPAQEIDFVLEYDADYVTSALQS